MTSECKFCDYESNAPFCNECGSSKNDATSGITCCGCRVNLPPNKKSYILSQREGCLFFSYEYCKECYEAELNARAEREQIYVEAEKAARAQCKECRKPFPGFFRKKRFAVAAPWGLTRDYYCEDCSLALPKNEKLDNSNDFDPWL
jgi:hypothetical protein